MKTINQVWLLVLLVFPWRGIAQDTAQRVTPGRFNSPEQQDKPYVILLSVDGFRHDYAAKHGAVHIQQYGDSFCKADYMQPSYPSLTFPNHYTIVTGLYPSHHGLVDNRFYDLSLEQDYSMSKTERVWDSKWYGGTPLWVLAEKQQMLSASFYWVGSEAPIQETPPTYFYLYNEKIPLEKRIQTVIDWLQLPADKRPHFISFYFSEIDHAGHDYGPDSPQTGEAVRWVDSAIHRLTEAVATTGLPVNFILVSDHGMTNVDTRNPVFLPKLDSNKAMVIWGGELAHLYVKNKKDIPALMNQLKDSARNYSMVLKKDMPRRMHYGPKDDVYNRIGDILLIPDWPYVFAANSGSRIKPGAHGYDPFLVPDMRAVFYGWGPAFRKNLRVGPVKNIDIYPVVAEILGLPIRDKIDGNRKLAKKILRK